MREIKNKKFKNKKGFTLIEALVFLFIFSITSISIYQSFSIGMNYIIENKKKIGAIGVANEEIEKMRNLGYENLSAGTTENIETIRNNVKYYISTIITNADDEEDGVTPTDSIPWDYYRIAVIVKWSIDNPNKQISMNAIIVPSVIEEDANLGYLRLHVIDQNGDGLANAFVRVTDLTDNELVYSGGLDSGGNIFLTGLDPGYHKISVSDINNIYPVETYATTASFIPANSHVDIQVKTLSEKTIQTDIVSTLNISLKNTFGETISNLGFDVWGGKFLGTESGVPSYSFPSESFSNSDGTESLSELSYGPYFFNFTDLNAGTTSYQFLWMDPISDAENKIFLDANTSLGAEAVLAPKNIPSLLVTVLDNVDDTPISGAKVHLQFSGTPAYDVELETNEFGKVYFPESVSEIVNNGYDMTVNADGFDSENKTVTISNFTQETVKLDAS
jgi:type II secretory pathway pseudopilin PulG